MKALELADSVDPMTNEPEANQWMLQAAAELRRLAKANAELLGMLGDVRLLCEWISESPHQRGSINGAASQLLYKICKAKEQQ